MFVTIINSMLWLFFTVWFVFSLSQELHERYEDGIDIPVAIIFVMMHMIIGIIVTASIARAWLILPIVILMLTSACLIKCQQRSQFRSWAIPSLLTAISIIQVILSSYDKSNKKWELILLVLALIPLMTFIVKPIMTWKKKKKEESKEKEKPARKTSAAKRKVDMKPIVTLIVATAILVVTLIVFITM